MLLQNSNFDNASIAGTNIAGAQLVNATWVGGQICDTGSIGKCVPFDGPVSQRFPPPE